MKLFDASPFMLIAIFAMAGFPGAAAAPTNPRHQCTSAGCPVAIGEPREGMRLWTYKGQHTTDGGDPHDAYKLQDGWNPKDVPCGKPFTLAHQSDHPDFTLEGCGGDLWLNLKGQFFANCKDAREVLTKGEQEDEVYSNGLSIRARYLCDPSEP
ncbi:hypothetical protein C8R43DRAFT_1174474 [Mycena crocata]|nr:hypothetical protein C8R43DRAFT_1174474 [Mycena crocata]